MIMTILMASLALFRRQCQQNSFRNALLCDLLPMKMFRDMPWRLPPLGGFPDIDDVCVVELCIGSCVGGTCSRSLHYWCNDCRGYNWGDWSIIKGQCSLNRSDGRECSGKHVCSKSLGSLSQWVIVWIFCSVGWLRQLRVTVLSVSEVGPWRGWRYLAQGVLWIRELPITEAKGVIWWDEVGLLGEETAILEG